MQDFESTEHTGRSHHRGIEICCSAAGGFLASFLVFLVAATQSRVFQGQLIAGDPNVNKQYPTTLNTMQSALSGGNPIASAMTSYTWWICVVIGGIFFSFIVFKLVRRYI